MLVKIGSIDITKKIEDGTYVMESEGEYIEWKDGNKKKHRVYTCEKVKGSFNVICDSRLGMDSKKFLDLIDECTVDGVLTITCWISNKAKLQALSAYIKITTQKHTDVMDILSVKLEER